MVTIEKVERVTHLASIGQLGNDILSLLDDVSIPYSECETLLAQRNTLFETFKGISEIAGYEPTPDERDIFNCIVQQNQKIVDHISLRRDGLRERMLQVRTAQRFISSAQNKMIRPTFNIEL